MCASFECFSSDPDFDAPLKFLGAVTVAIGDLWTEKGCHGNLTTNFILYSQN
ncbi:hypothetical protein BN903_24 [Halorubrum sp. AJ67]|nr:hypothetical protein BN903_24 [Halorubrum sp. AJ67]